MPRRSPSPSSPTLAAKTRSLATSILRVAQGGYKSEQADDARTVIAGSWGGQPLSVYAGVNRSIQRKNGIDMR